MIKNVYWFLCRVPITLDFVAVGTQREMCLKMIKEELRWHSWYSDVSAG